MRTDELWECRNGGCDATVWNVRAVGERPATWMIASAQGGRWTVAADQPICPLCASDLHASEPAAIRDMESARAEPVLS